MVKNDHCLKLFMILALVVAFANPLNAQMAKGKSKFLGNIQSTGQTPINFDMYWNQVTPGNSGKWASCEQKRDSFNTWLWLDRTYDHAKQTGYLFKEHTLIWGGTSGDPTWMKTVPQNEQMDEVLEWFDAVAKRYPDIKMIDVVNEPLHAPPSYKDALGGDGATGWDWMIWCFTKARQYFPNAKLLLNDYNSLNYTADCKRFLVLARLLKEKGLVDAIGDQGHSLENIDINTIKQNLDSLAAVGLDVYITEYEVRGDDATQLAIYKQQFPVLWEHPSVKGITLWGYVEGDMWRPEAYLLSKDGLTERPALKWLKEYFKYNSDSTKYRFDTKVDGTGTITLNPASALYAPFTNVTATAVPGTGYKFNNWTGDIGGSANPTTLAMTSNRSLIAHFVQNTPIKTPAQTAFNGQIKFCITGRDMDLLLPTATTLNANSIMDVAIYDIQGKQIWKTSFSNILKAAYPHKIRLSMLSCGSYFAQVKIDGIVAGQSKIVVAQ